MGQDFFSVDLEILCSQDGTRLNTATKGLFPGGEISVVTERARERSGSHKKYLRGKEVIFKEADSSFSIGILSESTALTLLMETCLWRTELSLILYFDSVIKDALSGSNYANFLDKSELMTFAY